MKKIKAKNETIEQMLDGYRADYIALEDSWFELTGRTPGWGDSDFWNCPAVAKVETLLALMWTIYDTRFGQGE